MDGQNYNIKSSLGFKIHENLSTITCVKALYNLQVLVLFPTGDLLRKPTRFNY